ncbi:MAG: hypothetical protein IJZ29_02630 [Clostridia bacterium]|nr:hypothetical protein [Clostridia bacterium]
MSKVNKITFFVLGLVVVMLSGIMLASGTFSRSYANSEGTFVEYSGQLNALDVRAYKYNTNDISTSIASVGNNGFVMLENAETADLSKPKQGVRFIIASLGENVYLPALEVNVFLNGVQLSLGDAYVTDENVGSGLNISNNSLIFDIAPNVTLYYYNQIEADGSAKVVEDLQGVYEFYFKVRVNTNGSTSNFYPQDFDWYKYSFTVLDQTNFGLDEQDDLQFPRIMNVTQNPAYVEGDTSEFIRQNIFNYNASVDDGTGNLSATYPALRFDPERYYINIKRTYNNTSSFITTRFVYTDEFSTEINTISDYGILYFDKKQSEDGEVSESIGFKLQRQANGNFEFIEDFDTNSSNAINYNLPIFYELGKYELTYKYQVFIGGEFKWEESESETVKIGTESLVVFGYTPVYAKDLTGEDYFVSLDYGFETDYSYKFVKNDVLSNFTIPSLTSFVSTNQSPVWLKSYSFLEDDNTTNSYYYYSKYGDEFKGQNGEMLNLTNVSATKQSYSKNTYFTDAGYYIVVLNYGFEDFVGRDYSQVFLFSITNTTPKVKIISNGEELASGGFTKDSVSIEVQKPKVFDSSISAYYSVDSNFTGNFTEYKQFTPKFEGEETVDAYTFTGQGKYFVRIYFNRTSYSTYSFTIDKLSLENQIATYSVNPYNITSSLFSINENLHNSNVVNVPFTVQVRNKPSNSPISVNLITYDVVMQSNAMQTEIYYTNDNRSYVYVDYVATNASSKQTYENIVAIDNVSNIVESNYVFDKQKIYIFEITDASGYRYVHSVFLDFTKAKVLQYDFNDAPIEVEDFNIVSEKTTMKWGENKALLFKDAVSANDRTAVSLLQESSTMYEMMPSGLSLIIPFENVVIESFDLTGTSLGERFNDFATKQELTIYPNLSKYSSVTDGRIKGEKQFAISIYDKSGNITVYDIEMNMDKSLGKMFTTNTPYISGETTYRVNKLNLEQAGSLDALVFEWKDAEDGAFKIASLTYDYYPLVYDKSQANYPYSDTATSSMVDILTDANTSGELSYSNIINPMATTVTSYDPNGMISVSTKMVTKPGKYVVTRKYIGGFESSVEESGDTSTKVYTYFVDSNPIIAVPDFNDESAYQIGGGIQILFGEEEISFDEFYREGLDTFTSVSFEGNEYKVKDLNLILKSNLLPIKIKVPKTKYSVVNGVVVENFNIPSTFNLTVTISKYNDNGYLESQKEYNTIDASGFIVIDDITSQGVYKMEIRDNSMPYNTQLSPSNDNNDYIAFRVVFEQPNAELVVGKELYEQSAKTPLTLQTRSDTGKYVYTWDTSVVDSSTLKVYRRAKAGNGLFTEFEEYNANIVGSSFELTAYETISNINYIYQYRVTGNLRTDLSAFTQFTPLVSDFDMFTTVDNYTTSTKENYAILTFEDPIDKYYAKIDVEDIVVKKYTKLANGNYSAFTTLIKDVDYVIEERLLNDNRIKYSILIYAVDDNNPLAEYKFEIAYHYLGEQQYYTVTGSNGQTVNYYSNSMVLVIDKTAPNYNLNRIQSLSANTNVLTDNGLATSYKTTYYKTEDGVYYFANVAEVDLAIDSTFEFTRPTANATLYSQAHEGQRIYFRKLNKYGKDVNMNTYTESQQARGYQSLVPGDPDYYEGNSARLRFNPVIVDNTINYYENWVEFGYGLGSFYDYMSALLGTNSSMSVDGYYEIVEIDEAGNHTIYTVILNTSSPVINANINTVDGQENVALGISTTEISSLNNFEITSVGGLESWYSITVNQTKFVVNPKVNIDEILESINSKFNVNESNTLTLTNRFGANVSIVVNISTNDRVLGILSVSNTQIDGFYKVILDQDEDGVSLKKLTVYYFDETIGSFVLCDEDEDGISEDSEGTRIIVDASNIANKREYNFDAGIYKFVFEDNFRNGENAYSVNVNIGVYGNYNFEYENEPVFKNSKRYTSGNVTLTAPSEMFTITATKNGSPISINSPMHIFRPDATSNDVDSVSGAKSEYVVSIYNITTGETVNYEFIIYNIFPAVNAIDSQDENMNSILSLNKNQVSTFTTKSLRLYWDLSGFEFGYNITLLRYDDGSDVATSQTNVTNNNISASVQGLYELRFTSAILGNSRSVYFMIKDSTISMYEVYEKHANGSLSVVLPAEELLDITNYQDLVEDYLNGERSQSYPLVNNRLLVKNYFSIYNFSVEVEGDKNLKTNFGDLENEILYTYQGELAGLSSSFVTNIIVVYGVSPYSYLDIFAITKIQANSKFLQNFGYSYDVEVEKEQPKEDGEEGETEIVKVTENKDVKIDASIYDNVAVYDAPLTVYWQSYYGVSQNRIYMTYYFNGKLIETTYGTLIDEQTSSFVFNTAGEYRIEFYDLAGNRQLFGNSNSSSFNLVLKNEVVYTINGDLPIYGAVYNGDVKLKIQDVSSYITRSLIVTIYKNGEEYNVSPVNYEYTFTEQGLYKILIVGSVREGNGVKLLKQSELIFSIIYPNEARFAYEFSNINGYEISKVIKNNIDITDNIKGENVAIYSLLLSEDSYGVGQYHIYVKGTQLNSLNAMQEFDYYIWINNEIPAIECSINFNETTTDKIVLTYSTQAIYEQIGNCKIVIGNNEFLINEQTLEDEVSKITIENAGTYFVTLQTEAGNVVSMFKVTKKDPLNAISIILIVLGVAVLIAGIVVFYRLRIRMRVK